MKPEAPGVFHALGDTVARATELVQLEFRLAKTELGEKAAMVKAGLVLIITGAVLLAAALLLVLQFLVVTLVEAGLTPMLATLVVAAFTVAVGIALVVSGRKQLDAATLTPHRTLNDLQRDSAIVKEKLS
jgi:NADH:ubiquinone oxidoreductase subunit K